MDKKKILFSAYSLDLGGIETALISLINYFHSEYKPILFSFIKIILLKYIEYLY